MGENKDAEAQHIYALSTLVHILSSAYKIKRKQPEHNAAMLLWTVYTPVTQCVPESHFTGKYKTY